MIFVDMFPLLHPHLEEAAYNDNGRESVHFDKNTDSLVESGFLKLEPSAVNQSAGTTHLDHTPAANRTLT